MRRRNFQFVLGLGLGLCLLWAGSGMAQNGYYWPTQAYDTISSGFGLRSIGSYQHFHNGIDIPTGGSIPLRAIESNTIPQPNRTVTTNGIITDSNKGIVLGWEQGGGYGNVIQLGNWWYCHLDTSLAMNPAPADGSDPYLWEIGAIFDNNGNETTRYFHFRQTLYLDPLVYTTNRNLKLGDLVLGINNINRRVTRESGSAFSAKDYFTYSGNSGFTTGPHLHLVHATAIYDKTSAVNPLYYLYDSANGPSRSAAANHSIGFNYGFANTLQFDVASNGIPDLEAITVAPDILPGDPFNSPYKHMIESSVFQGLSYKLLMGSPLFDSGSNPQLQGVNNRRSSIEALNPAASQHLFYYNESQSAPFSSFALFGKHHYVNVRVDDVNGVYSLYNWFPGVVPILPASPTNPNGGIGGDGPTLASFCIDENGNYDPTENACKCPDGQVWDEALQRCKPECPDGQKYDEASNSCKDCAPGEDCKNKKKCPTGQNCNKPDDPGGDHPDDNYDLFTFDGSQLNLNDYRVLTDYKVKVLTSGFFEEAEYILNKNLDWHNLIGDDAVSGVTNLNTQLLIVPSGGLANMAGSQNFHTGLSEYVRAGGTLLAFGQQYGSAFEALPGGEMKGYCWAEDQSCFSASSYIDTWHPLLAGQTASKPSLNVDGYFTSWPANSTVVLRRNANGQPDLIVYPYGKGKVIATTIYSDWAFAHGQA